MPSAGTSFFARKSATETAVKKNGSRAANKIGLVVSGPQGLG